jgi:hypothetical protein
MTTDKYMGRNQMLERLIAQVGNKKDAIEILQKRGHLENDGKTWTSEGAKRNTMTAQERALDRGKKEMGRPLSDLKYNPKTNKAVLKK